MASAKRGYIVLGFVAMGVAFTLDFMSESGLTQGLPGWIRSVWGIAIMWSFIGGLCILYWADSRGEGGPMNT